ncbi:hypothetical protein XENTR_v10011356 [Xenopus tropicalis]|nr:hypothetical protein XENTR_v10011356 [Xenopus tropicalis]
MREMENMMAWFKRGDPYGISIGVVLLDKSSPRMCIIFIPTTTPPAILFQCSLYLLSLFFFLFFFSIDPSLVCSMPFL